MPWRVGSGRSAGNLAGCGLADANLRRSFGLCHRAKLHARHVGTTRFSLHFAQVNEIDLRVRAIIRCFCVVESKLGAVCGSAVFTLVGAMRMLGS